MSELLLIRHGQATPFEADTDRLSELGERQARAVGTYLAASGTVPTRVVHGPLVRQARTARLAAESAGKALNWPAAEVLPGLAEYDGDGLLHRLVPLLVARDEHFARLHAAAEAARHTPDRNRPFQHLMEALLERYREGEGAEGLEPWAGFRGRVHRALQDLLGSGNGSTVLAFTSGGVIGALVAGVLDAPDTAALALNWRVRNASITRLTFGGGRVSLDSFNETGHLGAELLSWR